MATASSTSLSSLSVTGTLQQGSRLLPLASAFPELFMLWSPTVIARHPSALAFGSNLRPRRSYDVQVDLQSSHVSLESAGFHVDRPDTAPRGIWRVRQTKAGRVLLEMRRTGLAIPFASPREFREDCEVAKKWVSFPSGPPNWEKPSRETHYEQWLAETLDQAGLSGLLSPTRSIPFQPIYIDFDSVPTPPIPRFTITVPEFVYDAHLGEDVFEEAVRMGLIRVSSEKGSLQRSSKS